MPLAYYSRAATTEFWTEHWGAYDPDTLVRIALRSPLTKLIEAALPRHGMTVEAGCGPGQYVILLRQRGHAVVGVDWSFESLRRCRETSPAAPVSVMELGALGIKDGAMTAYLSLGVVEHDQDGPDRILREARRVLAPGGRLILSVPYLNGVRRLARPYLSVVQARLRAGGSQFYQYAFSGSEIRAFLAAHDFRVLSLTPYDPTRLLRKALRLANRRTAAEAGRADGEAPSLQRAVRRLLYTRPLLHLLGHMLLAVAVKR